MPTPSADAVRLAAAYRLALPERPTRGLAGELLGKGTGSSLEFQDRREYVVGEDLRHLDWGAYARTDHLLVRLYREEILPRVEVVLDASRSMGTDGAKAAAAVDLSLLLALAARDGGMHTRLVVLGDAPREAELLGFEVEGVELDGALPLQAALDQSAGLLRPGALRYVVSDFLSPHDARQLVRGLAARAGRLVLLQLLSADDADPPRDAAFKLTDAETAETLDLVLDERATTRYRDRLRRLTAALATETRRVGGAFHSAIATGELDTLCRNDLVPAGVLEPN